MYKAGIITISDKGYKGERTDTSGPKITEILTEYGYEVISYQIVPDEIEEILSSLIFQEVPKQ